VIFVKGKIFKRDLLFLNIVTVQLCSIQHIIAGPFAKLTPESYNTQILYNYLTKEVKAEWR
jgi:hypothetical protein